MRNFLNALGVVAVVVAAGGGIYWWQSTHQPQPEPAPVISTPTPSPSSSPSPSPTIRYPVFTEDQASLPEAAKLPPVDSSDPTFEDLMIKLFGKSAFTALFTHSDIVRRVVVSIDDATMPRQPGDEFLPLKTLESEFAVTGKGDETSIAASNSKRYAPYVSLAQSVSAKKLVDVYAKFYPLFQAAFKDLGKKGYFNDRLVDVIDDLLQTPEIDGPVRVVRPSKHNRYKFVDDKLETLSAGQKFLVRMGAENERLVKEKLSEIRPLLTQLGEKPTQ